MYVHAPLSSLHPHTDSIQGAIQSFRDEATRAVRHYISEPAPRQLRLDRFLRLLCILVCGSV